jgi:hypothetical protein
MANDGLEQRFGDIFDNHFFFSHQQMHGYDMSMGMLHGPPPPSAAPLPMEPNSHHHPDSTDSYVTYLESDESMQGSP